MAGGLSSTDFERLEEMHRQARRKGKKRKITEEEASSPKIAASSSVTQPESGDEQAPPMNEGGRNDTFSSAPPLAVSSAKPASLGEMLSPGDIEELEKWHRKERKVARKVAKPSAPDLLDKISPPGRNTRDEPLKRATKTMAPAVSSGRHFKMILEALEPGGRQENVGGSRRSIGVMTEDLGHDADYYRDEALALLTEKLAKSRQMVEQEWTARHEAEHYLKREREQNDILTRELGTKDEVIRHLMSQWEKADRRNSDLRRSLREAEDRIQYLKRRRDPERGELSQERHSASRHRRSAGRSSPSPRGDQTTDGLNTGTARHAAEDLRRGQKEKPKTTLSTYVEFKPLKEVPPEAPKGSEDAPGWVEKEIGRCHLRLKRADAEIRALKKEFHSRMRQLTDRSLKLLCTSADKAYASGFESCRRAVRQIDPLVPIDTLATPLVVTDNEMVTILNEGIKDINLLGAVEEDEDDEEDSSSEE